MTTAVALIIPGRFSFTGSIVLKEAISGTTIVGVRRYTAKKAVDLSLFTSVHSGYLKETRYGFHIVLHPDILYGTIVTSK